jgi:hypothetical protein
MGADGLGLPQASDWSFVMGLDLGFEDDYAIVVCAYSSTLKAMYHVYDFKDNHKDVYEIANKVLQVYHRFGGRFSAMVADAAGLGGMVIETLNKRYGLSFVRAEKKEKFDHIELMNSDFMTGRLKIVPGTSLDMELQMLQWNIQEDESKGDLAKLGKLKEVSSLPNHLCDALLYAWRFSHHFWSEEYVSPPDYGSPEWNKRYRQSVLEEMLSKREDRLDKIGNEPYNIGRLLEDDGWN